MSVFFLLRRNNITFNGDCSVIRTNIYDSLDWNTMLRTYPEGRNFDTAEYHKILSPDFPSFLKEYSSVPSMKRLKGVGLLCGTDWTSLYKNRFYYSRFDHSIGVALIVWHFTRDKIQTLSGLFHDIATPIFSHVAEFRKGDALTQTDSETGTERVIRSDDALCALLERDGIPVEKICDYHIYPVADNERPQLSADRLEYMFPSGAALQGSWTLGEIQAVYEDIRILKNERGIDELGFSSLPAAEEYCRKFCETGHILQLNENKLTLQLLADVVSLAVKYGIISEDECFSLSERQAVERFDAADSCNYPDFTRLYRTFRTMTKIRHTDAPLENHYCVNLLVKQRYINPLVAVDGGEKGRRLSDVSEKSAHLIEDFLRYKDSEYGCVPLVTEK